MRISKTTRKTKYKNMVIPLIVICIFVCINACTDTSRVHAQLDRIDTLLAQGNADAANMYIEEIATENVDNPKDIAKFVLLKAETRYKKQLPIENDSIDYAIFYYEQHGPKELLARAYYYKAAITFFCRSNTRQAIILLKKAEHIAIQTNRPLLKHKIYSTISYINLLNKNYATAIRYARKSGDIARKLNNKEWIGYSLTYIANAYSGLEKSDSNLEYLRKGLEYYQYLSKENQSVLLSNISDAYQRNNNSAKAELYIQKALKERPSRYTYAVLADFYIQRGQLKKAHRYLIKALDTTDVYTYEKVMHSLFKLRKKMHNYKGATQIADTLLEFQEKQEHIRSQNNIYDIQNKCEREEREKQAKAYRTYTTGMIIIFLLIIISLVLHHKYKEARNRRNLLQKHLLLNEYSDQLNELKTSQHIANKELTNLRKKINTLKDNEVQTLSNGKMLYESVLQNRNTIHWCNQDFLDFLEYFKLINAEFIKEISSQYKNLSPKQYLYLIATKKMDKDEQQIGNILAISPSSVRSIKSRIKSKKIKDIKDTNL